MQKKPKHPNPINISEIVPNWKKIWKIKQSRQWQQFFSLILTCCISSFCFPLPYSERPTQTAFENSHFKPRTGILDVNNVKPQQSSAYKKKKSCFLTRGNQFLPTRCLYGEEASVSQLPSHQLSHVGEAKRVARRRQSRRGKNSATKLSAWEPCSASCLLFHNIHFIEKGTLYK